MTTVITTINDNDLISDGNEVINNNFSSLNTNKIETSVIDTDTSLTANSDAKIATQKAVKSYVDNNTGIIPATTTTLGVSKLSIAPVSPTNPIAVGDNDLRLGKIYGSTTSSATPSINTNLYDRYELTSQAVDISSLGITGTPNNGDKLNIKIIKTINSTTTFIASNTNGGGSSSTSITISKPTGTTEKDVMISLFAVYNNRSVNSVPSGWVEIQNLNISGTTNKLYCYYKIATSSEPSDYTWGVDSAANYGAVIATYRGGIDLTSPIDVSSALSYVTNNATLRAGSVTNKYNNENSLIVGHIGVPTHTISSYPSGFNQDVSAQCAYNKLIIASKKLSNFGATGDLDSTISSSATDKQAFLITFNPEYRTIVFSSSFENGDYTLPSKFKDELNLDFIYNPTTSKFRVSGVSNFITGSGAPTIIPSRIGQYYMDTTNSKLYISKDVLYITNWFILN